MRKWKYFTWNYKWYLRKSIFKNNCNFSELKWIVNINYTYYDLLYI